MFLVLVNSFQYFSEINYLGKMCSPIFNCCRLCFDLFILVLVCLLSLFLLQIFNFSSGSFACRYQDWGCAILWNRFPTKNCKNYWSITCFTPIVESLHLPCLYYATMLHFEVLQCFRFLSLRKFSYIEPSYSHIHFM